MKLLTAVGPERMKFTQIDQELYDSFRENFPDFNIETVDEESMKVNSRISMHFARFGLINALFSFGLNMREYPFYSGKGC